MKTDKEMADEFHNWFVAAPGTDDYTGLEDAFRRHRVAAVAEFAQRIIDAPMIDHSGRKRGVYDIAKAAVATN